MFQDTFSLTSIYLLNPVAEPFGYTGLGTDVILYVPNEKIKAEYEAVNPYIAPERIRVSSNPTNTSSITTTQTSKYLMQRESPDNINGTWIFYAIGAKRAGMTEYTADKIKTITLIKNNVIPTNGSVLANWDASNNNDKTIMIWIKQNAEVKDMYDLYIGGGKIVAPENSYNLFRGYTNCTEIRVSLLNTKNVVNMENMFYNCHNLKTLYLGNENFDTKNATNMRSMFYNIRTERLDIKFNTSSVTDMSYMFCNCVKLKALDLGENFSTKNVYSYKDMFRNCRSLTNLNLGKSFNIDNIEDILGDFRGCIKLTELTYGEGENVINIASMLEA